MNFETAFKDQLRASGERLTSPRLAIFRILVRHAPISMVALIDRAREDGIDKVTVYRTLGLYRKLNLTQEIGLGRNRLFELSDMYHTHHHHITCTSCGRVTDFDSEVIEAELHTVGSRLGFVITSHQLEALGRCSDCSRSG